MRGIFILGSMALLLAGCQTSEQNLDNAKSVCQSLGYKVGSKDFIRCADVTYQHNQASSQAAANAAAAGVMAGALGGAIIASDSYPYYNYPYYRPGYYRHYYCSWACY